MKTGRVDNVTVYQLHDADADNGKFKAPIATCYVKDGVVCGFLVAEDKRGRGYGKALLSRIVEDFKSGKLAGTNEGELIWHCHPDNEASWKLAESCGLNRWLRYYLPK